MIDRNLNYGRHVLKLFIKNKIFSNVLDIGAGSGDDLKIIRDANLSAKLFALEGYAPNVKKLKKLGFSPELINLEKDMFPYRNNSFDLIIANQILEHCKELFWIFHEISRTLKVGGYFFLGVPNLASLHNRLLLLFGLQPTCIHSFGPHVRGFTTNDMINFIQKIFPGGYEVIYIKGSNFYPFPPFIANFLSKLFPSLAVAIFIGVRKTKVYNSEFLKYPINLETNFWIGK